MWFFSKQFGDEPSEYVSRECDTYKHRCVHIYCTYLKVDKMQMKEHPRALEPSLPHEWYMGINNDLWDLLEEEKPMEAGAETIVVRVDENPAAVVEKCKRLFCQIIIEISK